MKSFLFFTLALFSLYALKAQTETEQSITFPSEGKSMVYIIRSGGGGLINFRVYDYDKPIGILKTGKYIKYECEPGEHVFWASSENRDYIEANLEPNKIYVINVVGEMGLAFARVSVKGLDPENFRDQKLFYNTIRKSKEIDNEDLQIEKLEYDIDDGIEKYKKRDEKEHTSVDKLESHQNFTHANKPTKKAN